jgi:hypothetical protein
VGHPILERFWTIPNQRLTNRNYLYSNKIEWIFLGIEPTTKNSTSMTCVVAHDNKLSWQWKKKTKQLIIFH